MFGLHKKFSCWDISWIILLTITGTKFDKVIPRLYFVFVDLSPMVILCENA